jgi:hypothetical protein
MSRAVALASDADRDKTANRLLKSAADKFYDPLIDIDWDAPIPTDMHFNLEHRSSLYGTAEWDALSQEQRTELGKHELASVASNGIWFEVLLIDAAQRGLQRRSDHHARSIRTDRDSRRVPAFHHVRQGDLPYRGTCLRPRRYVKTLARVLPLIAHGPSRYAAILVAEEVLDRLQRETMEDETVQPLVRMVNRIHVLEEARHVTFARQEVIRGMAEAGRLGRAYHRFVTAIVSYLIVGELINPRVYRSVDLDPKKTRRIARKNPNFQASVHQWGELIMGFLDEADLIGGPSKLIWRKSMLL